MLRVAVIDRSAESRLTLFEQYAELLRSGADELALFPQIDLKSASMQEISFQKAPDVCILGPELCSSIPDISKIRKAYSKVPLIAVLPNEGSRLIKIEQLARVGVDDVLPAKVAASDFFQKLLLHVRKSPAKTSNGKLILVDSGKGGLGTTSVAAALAEALLNQGRKVLLIDLDFQTQDLSRFLQARPFINENLDLLLNQERPITEEFVSQCCQPVWEDDEQLQILSPVASGEIFNNSGAPQSRLFINVLELLDDLFNCLIVDLGSAQDSLRRTLYQLCDSCVFLLNGDPATLFASVHRVNLIRSVIAPAAELLLLENYPQPQALPSSFLRRELSELWPDENLSWCDRVLPNSKIAFRWPGSGTTLFSQGSRTIRAALTETAKRCLGETTTPKPLGVKKISGILLKRFKHVGSPVLPANPQSLALPSPTAHQEEIVEEAKQPELQNSQFEQDQLGSDLLISGARILS